LVIYVPTANYTTYHLYTFMQLIITLSVKWLLNTVKFSEDRW